MAVIAANGDILDNAIQLKIIARPGVGHQLRQRIVIHLQPRGKAFFQALKAIVHQRGDTVAPRPQRGNNDFKRVQRVVKLAAKAVLLHQIGKIDGSGGDHFDVHRDQATGVQTG